MEKEGGGGGGGGGGITHCKVITVSHTVIQCNKKLKQAQLLFLDSGD